MQKRIIILTATLLSLLSVFAQTRNWQVGDGLATGEVQQIIELPNGQILVNCEGVFCLTNGHGFSTLSCDMQRTFQLPKFSKGYAYRWQGDSLLWLRDFYRLYLFDLNKRRFRYDINQKLGGNIYKGLIDEKSNHDNTPDSLQQLIDSLGLGQKATTGIIDRQGGLWVGTRENGILYYPPKKFGRSIYTNQLELIKQARSFKDNRGRLWSTRPEGLFYEKGDVTAHFNQENVSGLKHNQMTFINQLPDGRFLLCYSLNQLGYFIPESREFHLLNNDIPDINDYRFLVGSCVLNERQTIVYSQNGAFILDIKSDTLSRPPFTNYVEQFSKKYNCMLHGSDGTIWIGTQNGLFKTDMKGKVERINGIANNCIRSLVLDRNKQVWAGTSCGVSRITPSVINLRPEDGIPTLPMMERAATLTEDGRVVFVSGSNAVIVRPESYSKKERPLPVILTELRVNEQLWEFDATQTQSIILNYNQNYLEFQFSTLNYATPLRDNYRYRLHGLEEEWHTSPSEDGIAKARYTALPYGKYVFEVSSVAADGTVGMPTRLNIVIRPPFWLTWWAKATYTLLGVLGIISLLRIYLNHKRKRMERENDERVNLLFELREEARHQFAQNTHIDPKTIGINPDEEALVSKLVTAIEANITNEDYNVDQLASDVAMSRSKLYDKMRNMLGITPADFIRNVRLKHAAQLLTEDSTLTIAEISERVGFATSRNFSTQFKKMFGVLPSEYREPKSD